MRIQNTTGFHLVPIGHTRWCGYGDNQAKKFLDGCLGLHTSKQLRIHASQNSACIALHAQKLSVLLCDGKFHTLHGHSLSVGLCNFFELHQNLIYFTT
jgi:hypothetical protein